MKVKPKTILKIIVCVYLGWISLVWAFIPLVFNDTGASGLPLSLLLKNSLLGILPMMLLLIGISYEYTKKYSLCVRVSIPIISSVIVYMLYFVLVYQVYG